MDGWMVGFWSSGIKNSYPVGLSQPDVCKFLVWLGVGCHRMCVCVCFGDRQCGQQGFGGRKKSGKKRGGGG